MRIWFALIVAPLLALVDQTVSFTLVGPACARQSALPVHACHALFLAAAMLAVSAAWVGWRRTEATALRHFLAGIAVSVAALSAMAILAMWIAAWMISPCAA